MIPDGVLDLGVEKGLITRGQALALRSLAREAAARGAGARETTEGRPEPVDEEKLRFVSGFADIFVTLGLILFLGSASYLANRELAGPWPAAIVAACAWALAEFFSRVRRMALPSIVLLVAFAAAGFGVIAHLVGRDGMAGSSYLGWLGTLLRPDRDPAAVAVAALGTAALAGLHYARFRVPITIAAGVGALALTCVALVASAVPDLPERWLNPLLFGIGLAIFALAMRFDLRDPERRTRRTDIAFWLHLLASPLIVHSLFRIIGAGRGQIEAGSAVLVLLVFAGLAVVAVLVDRRALLVSGLVYAGVAFASLIRRVGIVDTSLPYTLLALGALVLLLSAGWQPLRRLVLGLVPDGLAARLPRLLPA